MFRRGLAVLWLLSLFTPSVFAQKTGKTTIGDPAPPIQALQVIAGAGSAIEPSALRGKTVVLEFWGTWCLPCIDAIPHLNEVIEKTKGGPYVFLSVTDETEQTVRRFLEKSPINGIVAINRDRSLFDAFAVVGIPHTVVINPNGRVAAVTRPRDLTSESLARIAADQPAGLPVKNLPGDDLQWDEHQIDWRDGIQPIYQVLIKPIRTETGGSMIYPGRNHFSADGALLENLIQAAFEVDYFHLDYRLPESEQQYRVSVVVPQTHKERMLPTLQQSLQATFGFRIRWEEQEKNVLVLKRVQGGSPLAPSQTTNGGIRVLRGTMSAQGQPIEMLIRALTNSFRQPVIDETALKERYDWNLIYDVRDSAVLMKEVREKLGLELIQARRKVRMLVVEPE